MAGKGDNISYKVHLVRNTCMWICMLRQKTYRAFLVENDNLHRSILKLQQLNLHETLLAWMHQRKNSLYPDYMD